MNTKGAESVQSRVDKEATARRIWRRMPTAPISSQPEGGAVGDWPPSPIRNQREKVKEREKEKKRKRREKGKEKEGEGVFAKKTSLGFSEGSPHGLFSDRK